MNSSMKRRQYRAIHLDRRPPAGTVRNREPPAVQNMSGKPLNKKRSPAFCFFLKLAAIVSVCTIVLIFVTGVYIQHGNRMYPFLMDGDLLIIYKLGNYMDGDAVLYRNPATGEKEISRIAATGQNEVLITEEGQLLINGFVPDDQVFYPTQPLDGSEVRYPFRMGEEGFFLLDDFRTQGSDSRFFGDVTKDELLGKVVYVFRRRGI